MLGIPFLWTRSSKLISKFFSHLLMLILTILILTVDSRLVTPIYWNRTNPLFQKASNTGESVIDVRLGDKLQFVCPYYDGVTVSAQDYEYYLIYRVNETEYQACERKYDIPNYMILNCTHPDSKNRKQYNFVFTEFNPNPNQPDYAVGQSYFYISTSTGKLNGLSNKRKGACSNYNMKIQLKIKPPSSTNSPEKRPSKPPMPTTPEVSSSSKTSPSSRPGRLTTTLLRSSISSTRSSQTEARTSKTDLSAPVIRTRITKSSPKTSSISSREASDSTSSANHNTVPSCCLVLLSLFVLLQFFNHTGYSSSKGQSQSIRLSTSLPQKLIL